MPFLLTAHGLIHLLGFAKAFGLAELPALTRPISRPLGALWLLAAVLVFAAAVAHQVSPRWFWALGALGLVASQVAITSSWADARAGTVANVVVLLAVIHGFSTWGPTSLHAEYRRDVARGLTSPPAAAVLTEADLAHLPLLVQRYLRVTGSVGAPRVRSLRATFRGRMRGTAEARWMAVAAEQTSFFEPKARLFHMTASMTGVPAAGYHRYVGSEATMRVRVASIVPVVDAGGAVMTRAETVTVLNDMCILAPATLIDPALAWEPIDPSSVRATFTHAGHVVRAVLTFAPSGELVDFASDDRPALAPDGVTFQPMRWSTPVRDYRSFGGRRLASRGEAVYHAPGGAFAYAELEILDVVYDPAGA